MKDRPSPTTKGWEHVSRWYDGMVGNTGSTYHTETAIPKTLQLMGVQPGENVLDIGCGQGVLAPHVVKAGGTYIGVDLSKSLIKQAQQRHGNEGEFYTGDGSKLSEIPQIKEHTFDVVVFMLSIQDIKPHTSAIASATKVLNNSGRLVIFMTHPAFRIPRQSGWGFDRKRKLIYRRIDSYMSKLDVPLRIDHKTRKTLTRSYHRPLQNYIEALIKNKLYITSFEEITEPPKSGTEESSSEKRAREEIPLFLGIRAERLH